MDKKLMKNTVENDESKNVAENYNVPCRTYSDYYCKLCIAHMNSSQMWDSHIQGKRHLKNVKNATESLPPPSKKRYSDKDHSPPRKYRACSTDDEILVEHRPKSYRERSPVYEPRSPSCSPPPSSNPSLDFRDCFFSRAERDRFKSTDALHRSISQRDKRLTRSSQERHPFYEVSNSRTEHLDRSKSGVEMDRLRCIHEIEKLQRKLLAKAWKKDLHKKRSSCVSGRKFLPEEKLPCPKENTPSDNVHASANDCTKEVKSQKNVLNMDAIEAIRNSPPSMIIRLLEKLGPYVINNDEECYRLNKIAMGIERSCMDYKYKNLNPLQKKKILELLGNNPEFLEPLICSCVDG